MRTNEASDAMWWRGLKAIRQLMNESRGRNEHGPPLSTLDSEEESITSYLQLGEFLLRGRDDLLASIVAAEEREPTRAWRREVDDEVQELTAALRSAANRMEQLAQGLEQLRRAYR